MSRNLKGFVEYNIHPSAHEIAEVFWAMDTEEQAYFFNRLAEVSNGKVSMQLQYLTDNPYLTTEARVVMKRIGEYADKVF